MTKETSSTRPPYPWINLIWQPLCATLFICGVLYLLNLVATSNILWAVGAGSLASSCYIVFGKPSLPAATPSKMIGGYLIGIVSGEIMRLIIMSIFTHPQNLFGSNAFLIVEALSALSVGFCLVLMSLLNMGHPPAAGMALVLVLEMRHYEILMIIIASALVLVLLQILLKKYLRDLT